MALASLYFRPTPNTSLKSVALTAYAAGLIVTAAHDNDAWTFNGNALSQTIVSGTAGAITSGYMAAVGDGLSGSWLAQQSSALVRYTSGGVATAYALPAPNIAVGAAYLASQNAPYLMTVSGVVYTVSGAGLVSGTPGFGSSTLGLSVSGNTLFTLLPTAQALGFFNVTSLTGGTSGSSPTPMTVPSCLAASTAASAVAVGGWNFATLGSGFSSMSIDPATSATLLGATPASGLVSTWNDQAANIGGTGVWTFGSQVSGLGASNFVAWNPVGTQAFACDPTNGKLYVMQFTIGLLTLVQTLSITKATAIGCTLAGNAALLAQGTNNTVTPLTANVSGVWAASGSTIPIGNPESVLVYAASGAYVGCSSGIAQLSLGSGTGSWAVVATGATPLGFVPSYLTQDLFGNLYAAGTLTGSGVFAVYASGSLTLTGSGVFVGGVSGIAVTANQVAVADSVSGVVRLFGLLAGAYTQLGTAAGPTPLTSLVAGGILNNTQDLFASSPTTSWQLNFTAPYSLTRTQTGMLSIYAGGAWSSVSMSSSGLPQTVAWDPSGNVSLVTLQNTLWTYTSGLSLLSSSGIGQSVNQPVTTLIGISSLYWQNGHLYGSTSLNDSLVQIK